MRTITLIFFSSLALACGGSDTEDTSGDGGSDDTNSDSGTASVDECSAQFLREQATQTGIQLMDGITLEESVPLADLNEDPDGFDGQTLQIEGKVVEICDNRGCWAALADTESNIVRLKVEDGVIDFRDEIELDYYGIGEGEFMAEGEHGSQVFITGAIFTTIGEDCEL